MRRRKKPGSKEKLLSYKDFICVEPEKYKGSWKDAFSDRRPIYVELGTGKGQFITTLAEKYPDIYFIGFEIKEEVLLKAVEKAEAMKLKNILFLWYDIAKI